MSLDSSGSFAAVTPSDDPANNYSTHGRPRQIYVGAAGDVTAVDFDGTAVTFVGCPVGLTLNIRPVRINATGTSAASLVALF